LVNCYSLFGIRYLEFVIWNLLFGICYLEFVIYPIMELFKFEMNSERNLLPRDGIVNYFGRIFSEEELFSRQNQTKNIRIRIFKEITVGKTTNN